MSRSSFPSTDQGFISLAPGDFRTLKHAPSLKGLLRPFKGKGELVLWAAECVRLRDDLMALAQHRVLEPAMRYPLNALPVQLSRQSTPAGTAYLRWRRVDRSAMGVAQWEELMAHPRTPTALLPELLALELQRICLNMQISLLHTLAHQAVSCASKMERAQVAFDRHGLFVPSTAQEMP